MFHCSKQKILAASFIFSLSSLFFFENLEVKATSDTFSVEKISIPEENTKDSPINWYEIDSLKNKGKTILLKFNVQNFSSKEKEIFIEPRDAYAQNNQLLDITYPRFPNLDFTKITDPSYQFKQYATTVVDKINLKPGESEIVELNVEIPSVEGDILGAVSFMEKQVSKDSKTNDKNVTTSFLLENEYIIAVHLVGNSQKTKELIFENARPVVEPSRFTVEFDVENIIPSVVKQNITYSILDQNKKAVFSNDESISFKLPPLTQSSYRITWKDEEVKVGHYFLKINDTLLPFEVKKEKISEIKETTNPNNVTIIESENNKKFWIIFLFAGILNTVFIIIVIKAIRKRK
jgi:hypothetical protein